MKTAHSRTRLPGKVDTSVSGLAPANRTALMVWYSADTLALADGDNVTTIQDKSGHGYTGTAAGVSGTVVYKTNIVNGKPVMRFNGNHRVTWSWQAFTRCTYMIVLARAGAANNDSILASPDNGQYGFLEYGDTWHTSTSTNATVALGTSWCLAACEFDTAHHQRYVNGTAQTVQNSTRECVVGLIGTFGYSSKMDVAEFLFFNDVLPAWLRIAWETYLNTRYALW